MNPQPNPQPSLLDHIEVQPLRSLYFGLGLTLVRQGRFAEAIPFLEKSFTEPGTQSSTWQIHYLLGLAYQAQEENPKAFHAFMEAVLHAPERADNLLPYAQDLLTWQIANQEGDWLLSDWARHLGYHRLAVDDQVEIDFFLGRIYFYKNNYDRALKLFKRVLGLRPNDTRVMEGVGAALQQTGHLDQAKQFLQQAYDLAQRGFHPERIHAITIRLVRILERQGQFQSALERAVEGVVEGNPYNGQLLHIQGICYLALGQPEQVLLIADLQAIPLRIQALISLHRYDDALEAVQQAMQNDPGNPDLSYFRIQILMEGDRDLDEAIRLLQRYIKRHSLTALKQRLDSSALAARKQDGNALYFLAQVHYQLHPRWTLKQTLQDVEEALGLSFSVEKRSLKPRALQLKATILDRLKRHTEARQTYNDAGQAYYDAGLHYFWNSDFNLASELFYLAIQCNPSEVFPYWHLADVLRILSYQEALPNVIPDKIREALEVWNKSTFKNPDSSDTSWVYLVRESIAVQLARVPGENATQCYWEAIVYIERSLLWLKTAERWSRLSFYYRALALYRNAYYTIKRSLEEDKDNLEVIKNYAGILIDSGEFTQAEPVSNMLIEKLKESEPESIPSYKGWQAMVQYFLGKYDLALESIDVSVDRYQDVWSHSLRGYIQRQLGRLDDERKDNEWIWQKRDDPNYASDKSQLALTAFNLGYLEDAKKYASESLLERENAETGYFVLGLCAFFEGKLDDAEAYLLQAVHWSPNKRIFQDVKLELLAAEQRAIREAKPNLAAMTDFLHKEGGFLNKLEAEKLAFNQLDTSHVSELQMLLQNEVEAPAGSWPWLAAQAGLGRNYLDEKKWREAIGVYQLLQGFPEQFPEARRGLEEAFSGQISDIKGQVQSGQFEIALASLNAFLDFPVLAAYPRQMSEIKLLKSLALVGLSDITLSKDGFMDVWLYYQNTTEDPGYTLGWESSQNISGIEHYWAVVDALSGLDLPPVDFASISKGLSSYLTRFYQLEPSSELTPIVTPLILEIGDGLIPSDTSTETWSLFTTYIPEFRDNIFNELGVTVPGVRVRGNYYLASGDYTIMINEIPLARGAVPLNMRFCPNSSLELMSLGLPPESLVEAINPLTNEKGCWAAPEKIDAVTSYGLTLWSEPLVYIIHHLEVLVRRNLALFMGVQEAEAVFTDWQENDQSAPIFNALAPERSARLRIARLLRNLVAERISIANREEILQSVQAVGLEEASLEKGMRAIRLHLKNRLPGNTQPSRCWELPAALENKLEVRLRYKADQIWMEMNSEDAQILSVEFNQWLAALEGNPVLIVRNPDLVSFVRRLFLVDFPDIFVMSKEELLERPVAQSMPG